LEAKAFFSAFVAGQKRNKEIIQTKIRPGVKGLKTPHANAEPKTI